jgi:glycosyltransferase involved in cell wall biosynthesis
MNPAVSVVIPAYNAEDFLGQAIDSILGQSVPTEVIVVDDGSEDGTASVAEAYGSRVRCLRMPHRGLGPTRNTGLELAGCGLIAFLDADDVWTTAKLKMQAAVLADRPDVDMVFGNAVEFSDEAKYPARLEPAPAYCASAMLARRAIFDRAGLFSEQIEIGEFIDWYSRVTLHGASSYMLDDVVFHRRVHANNMTRRIQSKQIQYVELMRRHLERKRRLGGEPP